MTTSTQPAARPNRWLRAVGYGFLAEFATIITIILVVTVYRLAISPGLSAADYEAFGQRVGAILGIVAGSLFTFLFARLLMPKLSDKFIAHGLVVAATAVIFSVSGSLAGHHGLPGAYIVASVLKLVAGALAGWLFTSRSRAAIPTLAADRE